jgi:cyclic-di-AMP phosphodiesterase PgpH
VSYSWKDRIRNYAGWQRAGAFLLTVLLILIFLPKERLFKFEYQLNQPWKHEKLLAPFDFGVQKTKQDILAEQEEIRENQPLVFSIHDDVTDQMIADIDGRVRSNYSDSVFPCEPPLNESLELFAEMMNLGLIERSNEAAKKLKPFDDIMLYQNNQLVRMPLHKALSIQDVIDTLDSKLTEASDTICQTNVYSAIREHLAPNALYDDSLTQMLLTTSLSQLVQIEGKVDQNTTIIDQGDVVSETKFKILESLKSEYEERTLSNTGLQWSLIGEIAIVIALLSLLMVFIHMNQNRLFNDPRPITLALALIGVSFIMSSLAFGSAAISIYAIPIGITPLLLRMFYDFRISIFSFVILVLIIALFSSNPLEFSLIQISAISFATLYQASSTKRSRILGTALLVFIGYSVIYTFISLAQNGSLINLNTAYFGWFAINALLCTFVFPLIYVVEKIFGYVSETTLLELSESSQPLLRDLAIKAPGTFQHSLQVANLCEKVASKIGGNSILLRTAAMYHDVGKMNEPQFFIENQLADNNPHDDLEPEESAAIIVNHVIRGVEMCQEHNLPMDLIQFIQTHHGTTKVRFFLKKAQIQAEAAGAEVDEAIFSYPGPTPKTKEHAILMMCDSVEAASRSLKKYDRQSLDELVERIIDTQRSEGQFEEAAITLKNISDAKIAIKNVIHGIYHQRISYD